MHAFDSWPPPRRSFEELGSRAWLAAWSCLICCASLLGLQPVAIAQSGGIEVFAAETIFDQGVRVSVTRIVERKTDLVHGSGHASDPLHRRRIEQRTVLGIDYGLATGMSLSMLLPRVSKTLKSSAGTLRSDGLGDLALLGKWRVHKQDWKQGTFQVSVIGGAETPTGETSEWDAGARLPAPLQPGTGAWNPFLAVSGILSQGRQRYDARVFYKANTRGSQGYEKGDFFAAEIDAAYRFLHTKYPGPTASAKVGLQWRHEGRAHQAGSSLHNSGSSALLLRTGLGWHPTPAADISLAVDLPLHQRVDGRQLGLDDRIFLAVGLRF